MTTTLTVSNASQAPSSASPTGTSVPPTTTVVVTPSSSSTTSASESTLTSRQFITTTDSRGSAVSTAPDLITTESVSTSDGRAVTLTLTLRNAGGDLNNASGGSSSTNAFFNNTGAVAGVFVVVGLVVVGILTALAFFCLRRRRRQRLDREVTAAAIAASRNSDPRSGPLDDDMPASQRASMPASGESYPSAGNQPMQQYQQYPATYAYDPYQQPQYNYNEGYDYSQPTYETPAGYNDTPGQGYNYGPNGEYYFDPNQAERYRDEPGDAYGGYENYDSPMPLRPNQPSGTPPNEQSDPLHVCAYIDIADDRWLIRLDHRFALCR